MIQRFRDHSCTASQHLVIFPSAHRHSQGAQTAREGLAVKIPGDLAQCGIFRNGEGASREQASETSCCYFWLRLMIAHRQTLETKFLQEAGLTAVGFLRRRGRHLGQVSAHLQKVNRHYGVLRDRCRHEGRRNTECSRV